MGKLYLTSIRRFYWYFGQYDGYIHKPELKEAAMSQEHFEYLAGLVPNRQLPERNYSRLFLYLNDKKFNKYLIDEIETGLRTGSIYDIYSMEIYQIIPMKTAQFWKCSLESPKGLKMYCTTGKLETGHRRGSG